MGCHRGRTEFRKLLIFANFGVEDTNLSNTLASKQENQFTIDLTADPTFINIHGYLSALSLYRPLNGFVNALQPGSQVSGPRPREC